jgi:hypothetical protein
MSKCLFLIFAISPFLGMGQGNYAPNADTPGTTAIYKDSSVFVNWANNCITQRGPQDIAVSGSSLVTAGDDYMATEKSGVNGVVSLGDGGSATLMFTQPIFDGPGWDFAVFENSFSNEFLELAFVEVSSDGTFFVRFDATSEVQTGIQVDGFGSTDATEIDNLAGKYRGQYGTPFDLNELSGISGLDITAITHVKVIDVVGSISENYASYDALGNKINDPYPTDFASGGFDLDAVGVINEKTLSVNDVVNNFGMFPNPASDFVTIRKNGNGTVRLFNLSGQELLSTQFSNQLNLSLSDFPAGIYSMSIDGDIRKLIIH